MVLNFALAGRSRIDSAFNRLRHNPGYAVGIVLGSVLALQMSLVWGGLHTWAGWHRMRARLLDDGFVAFGEVLAPAGALHDFRDGIWRGLWRVHGGTIGFIILQMPIVAIIMLPWQIALVLCAPVASAYGSHPNMSAFVGTGIPLFFAVSGVSIILAQQLIAFRMLGQLTPDFKLGTLFAVTGESWRRTLDHGQTVVSLAILAGLGAGVGAAFAGINTWLGDAADLTRPSTIQEWILLAVLVLFGGLFMEAIGALSTEEDATVGAPSEPYSFTAWLVGWLQLVIGWLMGQGLMIIAVVAVFALGLSAVLEATDGAMWNDGSWGGLGWFIAAALILLHLRKSGGES